MLLLGDCLEELKNIDDNSVDLIFCDLPYGQTSCKWDVKIDLNKLWKELKRVRKDRAPAFFTTTTKYGVDLIMSNRREFRYDLVWVKSAPCGFLSARKMPMRKHEMVYVFAEDCSYHDYKKAFINLREYFKKIHKKCGGIKGKEFKKVFGHGNNHLFQYDTQWEMPTKKTYDILIKKYKIDTLEHFRSYRNLKKEYQEEKENFYNYDISSHKEKKVKQIGKIKKGNIYGHELYRNENGKYSPPLPTSVLEDMEEKREEHEMVYCFAEPCEDFQNKNIIGYFQNVYKFINIPKSKIRKDIPLADHCFRFSTGNFSAPIKKTYNDLIKHYKINEMKGFKTYEDLKKEVQEYKDKTKPVYDISSHKKTFIKESINKRKQKDKSVYTNGSKVEMSHKYSPPLPTSVLRIKSTKGKHRTEKPVNLMKWILKYYSKEGSTVLDPTMGSGPMGVACKEMNRKFIGIEMNDKIFEVAKKRLE